MDDCFKDYSLKSQENSIDKDWFNKYLVPSEIIKSSPETVLSDIPYSVLLLNDIKESPINNNVFSNINPTPFIKNCKKHSSRKRLRKITPESLDYVNKFNGLLNVGFNFENLDSDL